MREIINLAIEKSIKKFKRKLLLTDIIIEKPEIESLRQFQEQLEDLLPQEVNLASLLEYLERMKVDAGHYLMHQGDPPEDLYFIETSNTIYRYNSGLQILHQFNTFFGNHSFTSYLAHLSG